MTTRLHAAAQPIRSFGRRAPFSSPAAECRTSGAGDDLRLFAWTFAAGFVFVSVYLA